MGEFIMKRLLLITWLFVCSAPLCARDLPISSWMDLTEIPLTKNDCIVMVDPETEAFDSKQYDTKIIVPHEVVDVERDYATASKAQEGAAEQERQESKESEVDFVRIPQEQDTLENVAKKNTGVRYCIEDDSWWHTANRERKHRRLVVVPEEQQEAYWRTVLVITYPVFCKQFGWARDMMTVSVSEEYRFSPLLSIAGYLGLGAGIVGFIASLK